MTEETTRKNGLTQELIRGLFMILFFLIARIVAVLVCFLAAFQFLCVLIVRTPNRNAPGVCSVAIGLQTRWNNSTAG